MEARSLRSNPVPHLFKALVAMAAAFSLASCGVNAIPTAEENAKAKWADVQAQYQRRADLVPNLVATVKAAGKQEQGTLVKVTEARAKATSVTLSADDLSDPAKVKAYQDAQSQLSTALRGFTAISEAYPDLQTNANYQTLMSQLEGTENRITVAIRDYNISVQSYNTKIRTFPDMIGAKIIYGAKPMTPFQAAAGAEKAPDVGAAFNGS